MENPLDAIAGYASALLIIGAGDDIGEVPGEAISQLARDITATVNALKDTGAGVAARLAAPA